MLINKTRGLDEFDMKLREELDLYGQVFVFEEDEIPEGSIVSNLNNTRLLVHMATMFHTEAKFENKPISVEQAVKDAIHHLTHTVWINSCSSENRFIVVVDNFISLVVMTSDSLKNHGDDAPLKDM